MHMNNAFLFERFQLFSKWLWLVKLRDLFSTYFVPYLPSFPWIFPSSLIMPIFLIFFMLAEKIL